VHLSISDYSNTEDADKWEEGLYEIFSSLKTVPFHQTIEREMGVGRVPVRKILYRQQGVRRHYHVLYMVESLSCARPRAEPSVSCRACGNSLCASRVAKTSHG
jgi:hypothetical protein